MNVKFVKNAFETIPQETVQIAVSNINAYRDFIGNGVAVGKLAEVIIAKAFCSSAHDIHAFSFAFTGKNPPFDIMVYKRSEALAKETFTDLRRLYEVDFDAFSKAITAEVGSNNWCGLSLKNYLNHESQLTTNYKIRTICEDRLGAEIKTHTDPQTVNEIVTLAMNELSHETILLMNSFPKGKAYQFRLFNLEALSITTIEYSQTKKHSRYIFGNANGAVFHVKYGKGQANPFQRGLWVDDLNQLPLLGEGEYNKTGFAKYILDGSLMHHVLSAQDDNPEGTAQQFDSETD